MCVCGGGGGGSYFFLLTTDNQCISAYCIFGKIMSIKYFKMSSE